MRLIGVSAIEKFIRRHRDAAGWLNRWMCRVETADWANLQDVRQIYPSADGVRLKSDIVVTVFNVKGNEYRLLSRIDFQGQTVLVLDVMTHGEYSRGAWKTKW